MRSAPPQYSFSSGEISPLLAGRPDYQRQQTGAAIMRGFLPLRQGGATRAPGTFYLGETRSNAVARLLPFEFAENDAAVLEFTPTKMRVRRYGALVTSGASPYEMTHTYGADEIAALQWEQAADVTFIASGIGPIRSLSRLALDNWTIADTVFARGPFMPENANNALTITASAEFDTVTLTASASLFVTGHVGGLFILHEVDSDIPTWIGNQAYNIGDRVRHGGNVYVSASVNGTDSGPNPPLHSNGTVSSGEGKISWRFIASGYGIVQITARTNATTVTANVLRRLPPGIVSDGTSRWAEGAWSAKNGYPAAICIHGQRLYAAATPTQPRTIWASAIGDFQDMEPTGLPDGAFGYDISGGKGRNRIMWLTSTDNGLAIGALGEEYVSRSGTQNPELSIENVTFTLQSTIGSAPSRPVAPRGAPIFISRDRLRLYELRYDIAREKREPIELSLPSEHLGAGRFKEIAWQSSPSQMAWLTRESGDLAVMVTDPGEDVLGWAPLPVAGGKVLSLCITPSADAARDVVTCVVERTVDDVVKRYVEEFANTFDLLSGAAASVDTNHLFASVVRANDPASPTITGLAHLEGETVHVWSSQGEMDAVTVTDGAITAAYPVTSAIVGLFDATHLIRTQEIAPFVPEGSSMGRQKSVKGFGVRVHRTAAVSARYVQFAAGIQQTGAKFLDLLNDAFARRRVEGVSGTLRCEAPSGHGREIAIEFQPKGGAPATILALTPLADVTDG